MFSIKINEMFARVLSVTIFIVVSAVASFQASAEGIVIKGKISVRDYERVIWEKYLEELEITLSGEKTGEAAQTVNTDDNFSFEEVNPEDIVQILWLHDESTKATHVLFPFDQEGNASSLSNGLIRFRFRTMDWVLAEFKKRTSRAAIKGRIDEVDEIVEHLKQYHEILSGSKNVEQKTIDRYKHKLLQHICQKSEEQRQAEKAEFLNEDTVPIQRRWYVELLNITAASGYEKAHPAAIIRALNQWVVFSRQSYTKYNRWSGRDVTFKGELDDSLRSDEIRTLLHKDVILIANILGNSKNTSLRPNPFQREDVVNMNEVGNWIAKINRDVKPLANK